MNILMMSNTYKPIVGGLEKSIELFSEEYRKRGHRVVVAAPSFDGAVEEPDVVRMPAIKNVKGTPFSVSVPVPGALTEALGNFRPDVVHAHHPFFVGATALRVAHKHKVPLVFTHHTLFDQNMHYVTSVDSERLTRFVVELAIGYSNLADHVIAPSASVMSMLRSRGVESPVDVVPTGIDVVRFATGNGPAFRERFGVPKDAFTVGYLGRLAPEKNLEFLMNGVGLFLKNRPGAHFLVAGDGPSSEGMTQILAKLGVEDRAHAVGALKGQDLVDAYRAMDVFAFASQSETQGMVLVEAMVSGVPVVAVDACGVRDVVDDTVGRLLPAEHVETFAAGLESIAALPPDARRAMRDACLERSSGYSMTRSAERVLEIYSKLARKKRGSFRANAWTKSMSLVRAEWKLIKSIGKATKESIVNKTDAETPVH